MVWGELAYVTPPDPRTRTRQDLKLLRQTRQASLPEVLDFIERERLYGVGWVLVDMIVLASALITPQTSLWTLDQRLATLCERFRDPYEPEEN
jgi:hypothetical protein